MNDILLIQGFFGSAFQIYSKFKRLEKDGFKLLIIKRFDDNNWLNIYSYYSKLIIENPNPVIIIGHSFGAVLSIFLSKLKNVVKVYSISAFNNDSVLESKKVFSKILRSVRKMKGSTISKETNFIQQFMINKQRTSRFDSSKITLIHGFNDKTIPFSHFKDNIEDLGIPFERQITHQYGHPIPNKIRDFIISDIES